MGDNTGIQWTDATWNPVSGCSKVSPGCKNCYAERDWPRLSKNPKSPYFGRTFTDVRCHPERLDQPLRWNRPRRIFVNSMSDLFHEDVSDDFLDRAFAIMGLCSRHLDGSPWHTFQILTKRPERMRRYMTDVEREAKWMNATAFIFNAFPWTKKSCWARLGQREPWLPSSNVWLGVSVENQEAADERIPLLLETPAAVRFLSVEPLLGPVDLKSIGKTACGNDRDALSGWLTQYDYKARNDNECSIGVSSSRHNIHGEPHPTIDWVIVGGESGSDSRPCNIEWVRSIVEQCKVTRVPAFVKQLGANPETFDGLIKEQSTHARALGLRDKKGGNPAEWPEDLRDCREFPQ